MARGFSVASNPYGVDMGANRLCPRCGGTSIVEIVYGLPGNDLMTRAMAGKVVLGGCCISEESPTHACRSCEHEWLMRDGRVDI